MTVAMETTAKTMMSEATSLAQTQEMIITIFSCVGYLRDLFPEDSFQEHRVAGMNLKRFRPHADGKSHQFLEWIKNGCFDALSKKYLKSAVLTILADTTSPNNVLETYTLRVSYPGSPIHQSIDATLNGMAKLSLSRNNHSVLNVDVETGFKDAMAKILRTLCIMSQTLKALPVRKFLSMKLSYYDEVTPMNYEPPGFVAAEFDIDHLFLGASTKFAFGKTMTPFHNVALNMETVCDDAIATTSAGAGAGAGAGASAQMPTAQAAQTTAQTRENAPAPAPAPSVAPTATSQKRAEESALSQRNFAESVTVASQVAQAGQSPPRFPSSVPTEEPDPPVSTTPQLIKCSCGCNIRELEMLQCDTCGNWQHAVCVGFVSTRDKRLEADRLYSCYHCRFGKSPFTFRFLRDLSVFRKALAAISADGFQTLVKLSERLGVTRGHASNLKKKLVEEGFLVPTGRRVGSTEALEVARKDDRIKDRIRFYFNQDLTRHADFCKAQTADDKIKQSDGVDQAADAQGKEKDRVEKGPQQQEAVLPLSINTLESPVTQHHANAFDTPNTQHQMLPKTPVSAVPPASGMEKRPLSSTETHPPSTPLAKKKRKISIPSSRISCYQSGQ